jgi:quercetin dioxygenase-like cupin family protein
MSETSAAIVTQEDARVLHAFGEEVTILLDGERTDGALTMWTEITPPGGGPPPHYHLDDDETFHVIEGRIAFLLNGEWNEVGPGGAAFMPRRVVHTFKNVGDEPSRMVIMTMPLRIREILRALRGGICKTRRVRYVADYRDWCRARNSFHAKVGTLGPSRLRELRQRYVL